MSLLQVVHYPEPVLLQIGEPVTKFDAELKQLVEDMFATMYDSKGVGLAAPQVAVSKRMFVMDVPDEEGVSNKIAIINPQIIVREGEQYGDEGCLSFPGLYQKVRREVRTIVRYQDVNGDFQEYDAFDLEARCILHETDHCDGIVFLDRMSPLKRELSKRKINKMIKTGEWD